MTAKRKLAMSGVAIITVLTLVAGATMAWFTDTEKVDANFSAGVLDITAGDENGTPLDFENLRPMADKKAYLDEVNAVLDDPDYYEGKGYDPAPVYVQEFAISNKGTLPVNLMLKIDDRNPDADDMIPWIVDNGVGGVMRMGEDVACNNELGKAYTDENGFADANNEHFNFVLLQKSDDGNDWVEVQELSIEDLKKGHQLLGEDGKVLVLPAGETVKNTYALGAYLDSDTGNMYQGKEYHVTMSVMASQTDEGATFAE
ncbi:TasA family protein [Anaeromassilibacillus senegalensis]|uniref:TasA family protein n=1 Tax=Anaeromassilibacillus senegalensis TaxID=1673717 RepID=UPI0009E2B4B1|nr:TasA family protein [Anaeromassilibacillus senegalensis]